MTPTLTKADIFAKYPDREFWSRLVKLRTLADILDRSIVSASYKVPNRLVSGIKLTSYGAKLVSKIQNSANPRNECVLSMLLEGWWLDILVDPLQTDIEALEAAVGEEIKQGSVRHPFIYGRTLYDKAFEMFPNARRHLSHDDSNALLSGTQCGVFQLDIYVTGPYGVLRAAAKRYAPPSTDIPLYHCDDLACTAFHPTRLATGKSRISRVRTRAADVMRKESAIPSEWGAAFRDYLEEVNNIFSWHHPGGVIRFLADCFVDEERELILRDLLDNTQGRLRKSIQAQGIKVADADGFVANLDSASRLQLILLCSDAEIVESIDALVLTARIEVPKGELRRPKAAVSSGYFRVALECSSQGVRFRSSQESTLLRVHDLFTKIFDLSDPQQRERLAWIVRGSSGGSLEEKLNDFLRVGDMAQAVKLVAFDSERSLEKSKDFVLLGPRAVAELPTEKEVAAAIVWRVGLGDALDDDEIGAFHNFGRSMMDLVLRNRSYSETEQAEIRGISVNFFRKLESLLSATLKLCAWAFYRDHYGSAEGFSYSEEAATSFCIGVLTRKQSAIAYAPSGNWTLFPLIRGLDILADALEELDPASDERPKSEYPKLLNKGDNPFRFLFEHRHTFCDMSDRSRSEIVSTLRDAARTLASAKVDNTRNLLDHNNPFPSQESIAAAINAAIAVINSAESAGLIPLAARSKSEEKDEFGRRSVCLATSRGIKVTLSRPSPVFLTGMPALAANQIVVNQAVFADSSDNAVQI